MPAPRDSQTRAHCLSVGVLHSFLPHPSQPRPQSSPALSASNLCSERAPPARSGSRTEERNPLAALRSPPPAPEDGLRHWGAAGDRFFLQPGLRGRGHSAACGNRRGGLLGEIAALGNRDALESRAASSLPPPRSPPSPMHPGNCSPFNAGWVGKCAELDHKSQNSARPVGAMERLLPASAVAAVLRRCRGRRIKDDRLSAPCVP